MRAALAEAQGAALAGEVPVGAAVLFDGEILTVAQNRMRRDTDATAHAELLVLREAMRLRRDIRLGGCTLVVTMEPCAMCAGAIIHARVDRLVFGAFDDKAGMCGSVGDLVRHSRLNHQPEVLGGLMAPESSRLLKAFFRDIR
jgi:tRNA(adenine34) deaminase